MAISHDDYEQSLYCVAL